MGCCLCVLRIAYRAGIVLGLGHRCVFLLELDDIINIRKIIKKKGVLARKKKKKLVS